MNTEDYRTRLRERGLRVTPQRLAVFEAVDRLHNHPTAEEVIQLIRKKYPDIALGTVYKTLDTLAEKDILRRVKTDNGLLRYDAVMDNHHHIYCTASGRIEDYYDTGLTEIIYDYFDRHSIPDFKIEDIKLQIAGRFTDEKIPGRATVRNTDDGSISVKRGNAAGNRRAAGKKT
jgi:Fur family peroxide stress response transcriptional regulator